MQAEAREACRPKPAQRDTKKRINGGTSVRTERNNQRA